MKLTILGCYAASPKTTANTTAQVLELNNSWFLIDCGEGTQIQLRKHKIKFSKIDHIFISHLHGDHFFGLPGLITTFRLLGRTKELHIYGPKGIKEAITLFLKVGDSWIDYPLIFHELSSTKSELILDNKKVCVKTIPLKHRVYTNGFLFKEKPKPKKINIEAAKEANIHHSYFNKLKQGKNVINEDGELIDYKKVTEDPEPPKQYAFCSDTAYYEDIIPLILGADVLYHETTFLHNHLHLAEKTKHATSKQAAMIAKKAKVGQLVTGHYSSRYKNLAIFEKEAKEIFEPVLLGEDGKVFDFK